MTQHEMIQKVTSEFQKIEPSSRPLEPSQRSRIRREFNLQRIKHVADLEGMEDFEAVERDRFPKEYHGFQAFVNQNASKESTKSGDVLVDWNAPIKIKMILLPDSVV